jgi:sulfofructose kinase
VVGLGLCVVDRLFVVERFDLEAPRLRYSQALVSSGGMVGNALAQAARLGCETHVLSALGDDADGRLVRRELRQAGVRTRRLVLSPRLPTTTCVVLVRRRGGERRFLVPDRRALEARAPTFDLSLLDARSVLLVDGHFPAQARRALRRARRVGALVVADLHRPTPENLTLLDDVDHAVVAAEFCADWGVPDPRQALRRLAERTRGAPVVTLGHAGGLYLEGGRVRRYRTPRVRVVDTTGAGDAFHGALAAGLAWGLALRDALALGAHAAALNCTALGGHGRLLTRAEAGL